MWHRDTVNESYNEFKMAMIKWNIFECNLKRIILLFNIKGLKEKYKEGKEDELPKNVSFMLKLKRLLL